MFLNFVFVAHAALAFLLAFVLIFFAEPFTLLVMDVLTTWPTGLPVEKVILTYAQLTAVGLVLIGIVASAGRISPYSVVRCVAITSLVAIGLAFVLLALLMAVVPLKHYVLWINVIFLALYAWVWIFHRETI